MVSEQAVPVPEPLSLQMLPHDTPAVCTTSMLLLKHTQATRDKPRRPRSPCTGPPALPWPCAWCQQPPGCCCRCLLGCRHWPCRERWHHQRPCDRQTHNMQHALIKHCSLKHAKKTQSARQQRAPPALLTHTHRSTHLPCLKLPDPNDDRTIVLLLPLLLLAPLQLLTRRRRSVAAICCARCFCSRSNSVSRRRSSC